jgi:hypothetical protein
LRAKKNKKLVKNSVPASFEVIWEFHNRNQSSGAVLFFSSLNFPKVASFFSKIYRKIYSSHPQSKFHKN